MFREVRGEGERGEGSVERGERGEGSVERGGAWGGENLMSSFLFLFSF